VGCGPADSDVLTSGGAPTRHAAGPTADIEIPRRQVDHVTALDCSALCGKPAMRSPMVRSPRRSIPGSISWERFPLPGTAESSARCTEMERGMRSHFAAPCLGRKEGWEAALRCHRPWPPARSRQLPRCLGFSLPAGENRCGYSSFPSRKARQEMHRSSQPRHLRNDDGTGGLHSQRGSNGCPTPRQKPPVLIRRHTGRPGPDRAKTGSTAWG